MVIGERQDILAEFHAFCELPENRDKLFELIDGERVQKMASFKPSQIAMRIGYYFNASVIPSGIGYITGADGSYILSEKDEFMPDVAYISKQRLPHPPEREVLGAPDLAVEVKSPSDSKRQMRLKAEAYLRFGTQLVWLVFADEKVIEVYVPEQDVMVFTIEDTLDGGAVLPGFKLAVKDIFPE
jgi:Uma2 family endonuclease